MDKLIIFALPGNILLANALSNKLGIESGSAETHLFPDGESFIKIDSDVKNKTVILVCTLDHPNPQMLPLMFMAQTLKDLGAKKICLVSPYLPYMRQDKRFNSGEALTSVLFAKYLSSWIDGLITIDPHLHRIKHLSEIYSVPGISTLHATKQIAEWINLNVNSPLLIGPDEESRQWVAEIAGYAKLPFVIAQKKRLGDRKVIISIPDIIDNSHLPVLVDDIISSGASMIAAIKLLLARQFQKPICIGVHALFDAKIEQAIILAGASRIVTCNTISHSTNEIDITNLIATGIAELC